MTVEAKLKRRLVAESMPPMQRRALRRRRINRGINYLVGIMIALWIVVPIYLIASLAFSSEAGVRAFPKAIFPFTDISLETFKAFINFEGIIESTINSVIVALLTLAASTIIAAPAGYALSRYIFPGRDLFRLGILAVRAFPIVILAVPLAVMFINLNIFDEIYTVALMHTALTLPTTILVIASVFASVPRELEEAAIVFGATPVRAFMSVVLPLALPGIAATAIFTFVMSWNEVFAATILTVRNRTLPAQVLTVLDTSPEPFRFAGGFFMLIPSLIFIFFIRRYLFNMWGQVSK